MIRHFSEEIPGIYPDRERDNDYHFINNFFFANGTNPFSTRSTERFRDLGRDATDRTNAGRTGEARYLQYH